MDIKNLTPEERAELKAQLEVEERATEAQPQHERQSYNDMRDDFIERMFGELKKLFDEMIAIKQQIFSESAMLDEMQQRLFRVKMDRKSRIMTHSNGCYSIKVGNCLNDGWNDTVETGIEKVREYLGALAMDDKSCRLVGVIIRSLAKDQKGTLKVNKVLESEKMANEEQNPAFLEGIKIIKDVYRPVPTCQFVEVKYRDENDVERSLPLSTSVIEARSNLLTNAT